MEMFAGNDHGMDAVGEFADFLLEIPPERCPELFLGFRSRDAIIPEKVIERIIAETVGGDRPAVHWSRALQEMKTSLSELFSIQVQ